MNGIGRLVRRAFSEQGIHCIEARRSFVSCASSTTSFRPHDSTSPFDCSGQKRGLKSLCKFKGKSAGRNSSGRITIFHRGGGAKRLQRRIDLKRSTASMGVVERVEYDPNRSARIALVRWTGEMELPRLRKCDGAEKPAPPLRKSVDISDTPLRGAFSYAMMPGIRRSDGDHRTRKNQPKDMFSSAFSAPVSRPVTFPRIAIAGAGPAFVATRAAVRGAAGAPSSSSSTVCEVQKCDKSYGVRRMRREEALSWQSFREVGTLDLVTRRR